MMRLRGFNPRKKRERRGIELKRELGEKEMSDLKMFRARKKSKGMDFQEIKGDH